MSMQAVVLDIDAPDVGDAYVTATRDDTDPVGTWPVIHLPRHDWDELGQPAHVTVTIRPGDTLTNDEETT